jgi:hypothetical protein
MGTNCGASNPDSCVNDGCGSEYRSATQLFRSSDCGHNWTSVSTIDPASESYSNGAFGAGPCWRGWDREELYYDYWSNRLFATFNGVTDSVPETRSMFALRSPAGGTGTFSFNRINDYTAQPYVMTSLPGIANTALTGMLFMFSCEGRANEGFAVNRPILRWIDPNSTGWTTNNANWHDALINSGALKASFNDVSPLDSQTCVSGFPGLDGSQTVTRVGSYIDDAGVAWWTVRLGFLSSTTNVRVLTVRVNGVGDVEVVGSAQNFAASAGTTVAQLTAIEPDPAQTLSGSSWSGENTSLYYWRELNAGTNTYAIKAAAVRDAAGWQAPFTVASGVGTGKGGDFARGGFYFDSSTPETPLKYIMTWVGGGGQLKREVVALPAGLGNN